ncbi:hypothetical protein UFOVP1361_43 [uncultured Caudovirales phage]|uniref:Uncharacterized protein n=1 Tax=uncultured Caudovirales phage TaxID=2100421 RepID=A0A6J5RYJ3_9CAUD|nr:hypothetical protein UFOVP1361_43 [uncultured Caudovirales phage]
MTQAPSKTFTINYTSGKKMNIKDLTDGEYVLYEDHVEEITKFKHKIRDTYNLVYVLEKEIRDFMKINGMEDML